MHRIVAAYIGGVLTMGLLGFALEQAVFDDAAERGVRAANAAHAAQVHALLLELGEEREFARRCSARLIEQDYELLRLRAELDAARREQTGVRPAAVPAADLIPPTSVPER
jgi:hypothetical protein